MQSSNLCEKCRKKLVLALINMLLLRVFLPIIGHVYNTLYALKLIERGIIHIDYLCICPRNFLQGVNMRNLVSYKHKVFIIRVICRIEG